MKFVMSVLCVASFAGLAAAADPPSQGAFNPSEKQVYVVGTAHLDTQWRWTIQQTIDEFIPATLEQNFALFKKYPDYVFSFEGAFRYMLMKEYYPAQYDSLKQYIATGRWRVAGSWVDAVDTNIPSPESLIRHTLLGNGYFRHEFGVTSRDVFLPDCFGFGYALPSIAAHCGIQGFSSQKLTWGSSVGVPFDIGVWRGVDGSRLFAALNPGAYVAQLDHDLSADSATVATVAHQGAESGFYAAFKYVGTGDQGGSPTDSTILWLERSMRDGKGPIRVRSTSSDQFARDLSAMPAEVTGRLPTYRGELLMTRHGAGCYTSEAAMKRWNRKNERLADAAERASVIASWLGGARYPHEMLNEAWVRFLWHQFHDDLTGTSIPQAYTFSWNDEAISQNQFASVLQNAGGAIARAMDTRAQGVAVVVYNPLSIEREDIVEARITYPDCAPKAIRVYAPDGVEVPSQAVLDGAPWADRVIFRAKVPPVGFAVYDVRSADTRSALNTDLVATDSTLSNRNYRIRINTDGDIASIFDKRQGREMLSSPIRLQMLEDTPHNWAAWEIDYEDLMAPPREYVRGPAEIHVIENGPARAAVEVVRRVGGSTFKQQIRLGAGDAGERIEVVNDIDWRTSATLLAAAFPLTAFSDTATYDLGLGTIERPTNNEKKYEVPAQQWADLTDASGSFGIAILNDCKYGWDKPDAHTLRLTLIHTPGINDRWKWIEDQRSMDLGHHRITYAIYAHAGEWTGQVTPQADRLNQPLVAFQMSGPGGGDDAPLGRRFSFLEVSNPAVAVRAVKMAEDSDEIVVRLEELNGDATLDVHLAFALPIVAAREVNGAEEPIGPCVLREGRVVADFAPYQPRTFAVRLAPPRATLAPPTTRPLEIPYNLLGITNHGDRNEADFDGNARTLPGELLPATLLCGDIPFVTGPRGPMKANMLACQGQKLAIPAGDFDRLYILACAAGGDRRARFLIDDRPVTIPIQDCEEPIAQWDNRVAGEELHEDPATIAPGYTKGDPIAWVGTHRHRQDGGRDAYSYFYLYKYVIVLPHGARAVTLPDDYAIRIAAITAAKDPNAAAGLAQTFYDRPTATLVTLDAPASQFLDSLRVAMQSPIGGAEIHYTLDGSEPTQQSRVCRRAITLWSSATIRARAFAPGMDDHFVASATFTKLSMHDAVQPPTPLQFGLRLQYFEGAWEKIPDFSSITPVRSDLSPTVRLPAFSQPERFALTLAGYIRVPLDGTYTFHLWSDDGSALYIDDNEVVDNDGPHGRQERKGAVALRAGLHPVRVEYYQGVGDAALELQIEGPGLALEDVPAEMLLH